MAINADEAEVEYIGPSVFSERLRELLSSRARYKAKDFSTFVVNWINSCLEQHCTPMFRTRYAGRRWGPGLVLGVCWGCKGVVSSMWFENVPEADIRRMESTSGDWRWILEKYSRRRTYPADTRPAESWWERANKYMRHEVLNMLFDIEPYLAGTLALVDWNNLPPDMQIHIAHKLGDIVKYFYVL
jgi:hypothetical protein